MTNLLPFRGRVPLDFVLLGLVLTTGSPSLLAEPITPLAGWSSGERADVQTLKRSFPEGEMTVRDLGLGRPGWRDARSLA